MSVKYIVSIEVFDRLWDEYFDSTSPIVGFENWILSERIPYAKAISLKDELPPGVAINFKEEKDLTYFLLTL